jgi:exopolysaccharide biosynthesis polyprenyl glycosylphosphotransferase
VSRQVSSPEGRGGRILGRVLSRAGQTRERVPPPGAASRIAPADVRMSHRSLVRHVLVVVDAVGAAIAVTVGLTLADPDGRAGAQIPYAIASVAALVLLLKLYGLYDRDANRVSSSTVDDVPGAFHAVLIWVLALWALLKVADDRLVLAQAATVLPLALAAILGLRAVTRRAVRMVAAPERVIVVGGGPEAAMLARKIDAHPEYALDAVCYVADEGNGDLPGGVPWQGSVADLPDLCRRHAVERVIMADPAIEGPQLTSMVRDANDANVKVSVVPHVVDVLGPSTELDDIEGMTVLGISAPRLSVSSRALKRTLDLVVSTILLVLLIPLLPIVALAIKLDSPGPVFFSHERLGQGGRLFRLFKFRTMVVDAEARADDLRDQSRHPVWLLVDRDPRITRVGNFLRHTSIDELPQLLNVLRGEMSLVGPRPMPARIDRHITGWGRRRLDLKPGLTGLWQVLGRTEIPFEEMIKLDYVYVTNWSLWGDVRLLVRTFFAVVSRRGAN